MKHALARELVFWSLVASLAATSGVCAGAWIEMGEPQGDMLEQVLARSQKPDYYRQKYAADINTMCHECSHDVNNRLTNQHGGMGVYGFYVGDGKAAVFREPKVRISDIARRVQTRYRNYDLYFNQVGPQQDTSPLYILDEWVAAINGAVTSHERNAGDTGDRYMAAEFSHYANAVLQTIREMDPGYPELADLEEFVDHEKKRTQYVHSLPKQPSRPGMGGTETFMRTSSPMQSCVDGSCYGGGWQPATRPQQVIVQPVQPTKPVVDTAASDKLREQWIAYIDRRLLEIKPCQCDHSGQVTADQVTDLITAAVANIQLKPGPPGPPGPAGPQGPAGEAGKPPETPIQTGEQHIVIVADRNSSWWPRLAEDIEKTKDTYVGIRVAPVPDDYAGEIPTAVVYEDNVPVRVVPGVRNVIDLLSRVRRGMSI
jgi:hypothetical protein